MDINTIFKINDFFNDVDDRIHNIKTKKLSIIYNESIVDKSLIYKYIIKNITNIALTFTDKNYYKKMIKSINAPFIKLLNDYNEMFYYLNRGFVIVLFSKYMIVVGISKSSNPPISKKEENSNISFIRRRNKLESFILEEIVIGKEATDKLNKIYIKDMIKDNLLGLIKDATGGKKIRDIAYLISLTIPILGNIIPINNGLKFLTYLPYIISVLLILVLLIKLVIKKFKP